MRLIRRLQSNLFLGTVIIVLFFGALSPVFRDDYVAKGVGVFSAVVLTVLSMLSVFRRPEKS